MTDTFRRYTDVLSLLDMIQNERLSLLSPSLWYDQNDSFGLDLYSKRLGKGSVYALCLASSVETAHHWQIFSGHSHGLCIQLDREGLISHLDGLPDRLLHGPVEYLNLTQVRALKPIPTDRLPFLKRETFKAENEYRVIAWQDDFFATDSYTIPLPLSLIHRVTFAPAMPRQLAETLKAVICAKPGCEKIPFALSRLNNNESWRKAVLIGTDVDTLPEDD